jgi:hypothetical protein
VTSFIDGPLSENKQHPLKMGPKKKAGGEGKKTGKTSKLAKMNEQERAKYLEKKMAEEEEVKRRKEEMITVFLKVSIEGG